jgi:transposase
MSRNSTDYDGAGSRSTSVANGDSHDRNYYPMGITKHYFETMEERSGKDYRWIKPLSQPVSQLMM